MGRIETGSLGGDAADRVYIAGKLREALAIEKALTEAGYDYEVSLEPFVRRVLFFPREYTGAAFYVAAGRAEECRAFLLARGFRHGISRD